jgi:hypothetical protein
MSIKKIEIVYLIIGLLLISLANSALFSAKTTVNWDALDSIWPFMRWYGSALHAGYFPDYFPNIFSGFPVGAEILVGPYNLLYLSLSYAFPDSTLSINLLYLISQCLVFALVFFIGKTYKFDPIVNLYFGFSIVASGYIVGHASHFSHLQSAVSLLACFLSLRLSQSGSLKTAFVLMVITVYHACTSAYVQNIVFGAQILAAYLLYTLYYDKKNLKAYLYLLLAILLGVLISLPAIWHFYSLFSKSLRFIGQSPEAAMQGSLSVSSLLNVFNPIWRMSYGEPTMERFHLIFSSSFLIVIGIIYSFHKKMNRTWVLLILLVILFLVLLALGKNSFLPIRLWLAENFYIYRTGKYPSAEHRGVALFLLGLISAYGANIFMQYLPKLKYIFLIFIVFDFFIVKYLLSDYQYHTAAEGEIKKPIKLFQAEYKFSDQYLIDTPRNCNPNQDSITPILIERNFLAPANFYWSGYESMSNAKYEEEKFNYQKIICGPSRLWNYSNLSPRNYKLELYSPGSIEFIVGDDLLEGKLIWSDVYDEFWNLAINGKSAQLIAGPANLRLFSAKSGDRVTMTYRGPLTRLWR